MSAAACELPAAWDVAAATPDPELPMLTVADLGILRAVEQHGGTVVATITPTYSGCPAMREISLDVQRRLQDADYRDVEVRTQLAPPWTSDWITADGRRKLHEAGIAAPAATPTNVTTTRDVTARGPLTSRSGPTPLTLVPRPVPVSCPLCGAAGTVRTAEFSGTACKALYRCQACREPFEYVKAI